MPAARESSTVNPSSEDVTIEFVLTSENYEHMF